MLKFIGALWVMIACIGYTSHLLDQQKQHRNVLQSLIAMSELLSDKIRYERMTMEEALGDLNKRYHGMAGAVVGEIGDRLSDGTYESFEYIWSQVFFANKKRLMLTEEEYDIVLEMGKNLGSMDVETQVRHLRGCQRQLQQKLDLSQRELREKRRIYRYLGVAVGVMVILVLV